ncbi:MAG: YscO family type III secretion system apparatus protein [Kiritimatiellae bacterium]|nr:YscO family type III secretion system apparatus protein [Kiritimatiellia bacterium]
MAYMLQPLLKIRLMREDRATGELTAARQAREASESALADRRRELASYEETREERRDRIYDAIMGRPVAKETLDLAAEGVARIDEEGVLKADNVKRAEADLRAREEQESAARQRLNLAIKERMKIDEHKSVWIASEAHEQELRAEGELEDFVVRKQEV